jgi:hypothetical protein
VGVQAGAIDAGAASTTINGLAGRPSCILFLGTNQVVYESAWAATQGGGFFGFAAEDTDGTIHNYCEFAILTTGRCSNLTQTCARAMTSAGAVTDLGKRLYEASVTDITDDGFTIEFSQIAPGFQIHYLATWDIQPGYVFPYEPACDGTTFVLDVGFEPAVYFAHGQRRNTCHAFPKSTSASLWNGMSWGDVSAGAVCHCAAAQSVIAGQFVSDAETPFSIWAGVADPFVIGSICTGTNTIAQSDVTEITIENVGCGDGYDWIFAQFSQCFVGRCESETLGGGSVNDETPVTLGLDTTEAVIFNNFQDVTQGAALGKPKRWGVGFATAGYQCCFSIDESSGTMYQSESDSWVTSATNAPAVSSGDVNFDPTSGDFSLVLRDNSAGDGDVGFMAVQTKCEDWIPLIYRIIYCQ